MGRLASPKYWAVFLITSIIKSLSIFLSSYHSTDFEVHRHWLATTFNLPIGHWYYDVSSEWTLDYPPFFAWFEYGLAQIAHFFFHSRDPHILSLQHHDYASFYTILFQRGSVIVADVVLFIGACLCLDALTETHPVRLSPYTSTSLPPSQPVHHQSDHDQPQVSLTKRPHFPLTQQFRTYYDFFSLAGIVAILLSPGLCIIDHIHFQYNGFLYGMLFLSFAAHLYRWHYIGAILFTVVLWFKHIYVYLAPGYAFFLLFSFCYDYPLSSLQAMDAIPLQAVFNTVHSGHYFTKISTFQKRFYFGRFFMLIMIVFSVTAIALGPILCASPPSRIITHHAERRGLILATNDELQNLRQLSSDPTQSLAHAQMLQSLMIRYDFKHDCDQSQCNEAGTKYDTQNYLIVGSYDANQVYPYRLSEYQSSMDNINNINDTKTNNVSNGVNNQNNMTSISNSTLPSQQSYSPLHRFSLMNHYLSKMLAYPIFGSSSIKQILHQKTCHLTYRPYFWDVLICSNDHEQQNIVSDYKKMQVDNTTYRSSPPPLTTHQVVVDDTSSHDTNTLVLHRSIQVPFPLAPHTTTSSSASSPSASTITVHYDYSFTCTHLYTLFDRVKLNVAQLLSRLFPFRRGLIHSYWAANGYAGYVFVDTILGKLARIGLHQQQQQQQQQQQNDSSENVAFPSNPSDLFRSLLTRQGFIHYGKHTMKMFLNVISKLYQRRQIQQEVVSNSVHVRQPIASSHHHNSLSDPTLSEQQQRRLAALQLTSLSPFDSNCFPWNPCASRTVVRTSPFTGHVNDILYNILPEITAKIAFLLTLASMSVYIMYLGYIYVIHPADQFLPTINPAWRQSQPTTTTATTTPATTTVAACAATMTTSQRAIIPPSTALFGTMRPCHDGVSALDSKHAHDQRILLFGATYAALCSFIFGWHVHEKAILMALLPLTLLSIADILTALRISLYATLLSSSSRPTAPPSSSETSTNVIPPTRQDHNDTLGQQTPSSSHLPAIAPSLYIPRPRIAWTITTAAFAILFPFSTLTMVPLLPQFSIENYFGLGLFYCSILFIIVIYRIFNSAVTALQDTAPSRYNPLVISSLHAKRAHLSSRELDIALLSFDSINPDDVPTHRAALQSITTIPFTARFVKKVVFVAILTLVLASIASYVVLFRFYERLPSAPNVIISVCAAQVLLSYFWPLIVQAFCSQS